MKARRVKKLDPGGPLPDNAARIISVRLDELLSLAPQALERDQVEAQHDLRIAAKRLRYVLELTGFCFGPTGDTARRRARDLQDILGEIHDCDVMLPRVHDRVAALRTEDARAVLSRAENMPDLDPRLAARAPHRTSYRGLEVLAVYLEARRNLLFDRFCAFWARQERVGTWLKLETAAEQQLARAREAKRARLAAERARADAEAAERAKLAATAEAERARLRRDHAEREAAEHALRSDVSGSDRAPAGSPQTPSSPESPLQEASRSTSGSAAQPAKPDPPTAEPETAP